MVIDLLKDRKDLIPIQQEQKRISLVPVGEEDAPAVAALAGQIWREHYTGLLGPAQVAYMVERFQSAPAVARQLRQERYRYWFFLVDGERAGYLGVQPQEDGSLYLSKLYLAAGYRGLGLSRLALQFLQELCRREGMARIWLTVNRHNGVAIRAYESLGMTRTREQKADIGGGFVMDDYIYEIPVDSPAGAAKGEDA